MRGYEMTKEWHLHMDQFKPPDDFTFQASTTQSSTPQSATPQSQSPGALTPQAMSPGAVLGGVQDLDIGQIIEGRYRILSLVGRGGVGSVYKVEQIALKKTFALKTLQSHITNQVTILRFQNEARTASKLNHPNLIRAVDFGLIDGTRPFLVMDFVHGITLSRLLRKNTRLSLEQSFEIFIPVLEALDYAHKEGVIHRDIKPSNIVLVDAEVDGAWHPKVVDFGIAKIEDGDGLGLTRTGEVFGTPLYMSPEQCSGFRVDNKSDVYSLGCVIFEALTGAPPFRGNSALETMLQHQTRPPLSLTEASLGLEFPAGLNDVVLKMLAKDPKDRYDSCLDVVEDLRRLRHGEHLTVVSKSEPEKISEERLNNGNLLWAAASIFIVAIILLWCQILSTDHKNTQVQTSSPSKQAPIEQAQTDGDNEDTDFSTVEHGKRVYNFPKKRCLGELVWWENPSQKQVRDAIGRIEVPLNTRTIFIGRA